MIPKLWRYLLSKYLQIFFLSVCSFIAILLVSRFKDVARFAAVTADWGKTGLFLAYQIPIILPMAAPISALIASLLLFQRLNRSYELTALRSSGIGLGALFAPLFFASALLSVLHFSLCAEIAPYCRRESRTLLYRETSANPLLLLQRQRLVKIPDIFLKMKVKEEGKVAHDLLLIAYNEAYERLSLITARRLSLDGEQLLGEDVALITPLELHNEEALLIENQSSIAMETPLLSAAIRKNRPSLDASTLNLRMLRLRSQEWGRGAQSARVEILRRISLSLSLFSFTLLGFAFGIELSRVPTKKGLIRAVVLALTVLVSYLLGRALKQDMVLASLAFLAPHPFIWLCSGLHLRKISRGQS